MITFVVNFLKDHYFFVFLLWDANLLSDASKLRGVAKDVGPRLVCLGGCREFLLLALQLLLSLSLLLVEQVHRLLLVDGVQLPLVLLKLGSVREAERNVILFLLLLSLQSFLLLFGFLGHFFVEAF